MLDHALACLLINKVTHDRVFDGTLSCVTLLIFCISHFLLLLSTMRPSELVQDIITLNDCSKLSRIYLGATHDPYSKIRWSPPPVTWPNTWQLGCIFGYLQCPVVTWSHFTTVLQKTGIYFRFFWQDHLHSKPLVHLMSVAFT